MSAIIITRKLQAVINWNGCGIDDRTLFWDLTTQLEDLDYGNNIVLLEQLKKDIEVKTEHIRRVADLVGLEITITITIYFVLCIPRVAFSKYDIECFPNVSYSLIQSFLYSFAAHVFFSLYFFFFNSLSPVSFSPSATHYRLCGTILVLLLCSCTN